MALTVVRGLLARGDTDDTLDDERRPWPRSEPR